MDKCDEIEIKFSGIRPGEKMYEELLGEDEIHPEEIFEKIYIGRTDQVDITQVLQLIDQFEQLDNIQVKDAIMAIVFAEQKIKTSIS